MTVLEELKYSFTIMGKVKAKQSVKFGRNGIKYTPKDMVDYSNWVKQCFMQAYPNHNPAQLSGYYLDISIDVHFKVPNSFSKKKKQEALEGFLRPAVKPDWDNISKNICDALNGIAYPDDKAIVSGRVNKVYDEYDYTEVKITAFIKGE